MRWRVLVLIAVIAALAVTGVWRFWAHRHVRARHFVLIVIDALRPDCMGCYGNRQVVTPSIDRFAATSWVFDNARAPASWTLPSNAALFSGRYPHEVCSPDGRRLDGRTATMAEVFRKAGYRTAAFSTHVFISPAFGFEQGFDTLVREGTPVRLTRQAAAWLDEHRNQPYLVLVYYTGTHHPYRPPDEYRRRFARDNPTLPKVVLRGLPPNPKGMSRQVFLESKQYAYGCYLGAAAFTDRLVGDLLPHVPPDAVVLVTSDHGEAWYEHKRAGHTSDLYDEQVRIPAIMRLPGERPRRIATPYSNYDVMPTFLDAAGIGLPNGLVGVSWLRPNATRTIYGELGLWQYPALGIVPPVMYYAVRGNVKVIYSAAAGRYEYLDLARDPHEQHPVENPGRRFREVAAELGDYAKAAGAPRSGRSISPQLRRELGALGYVK